MDQPIRGRVWPFLVAFAVLAAVYTWTTCSNNLSWHFGAEQRDYYNLLVHGFLDGKLSLKAEVPPALLNSPNPYDPALRPEGVALHDASLYHGRYYIYYGVVPAVVALLPFRLICGFDLPVPVAVLGFALAALAVALAILAQIRQRYFPRCGPGMTCLLAIGFGFASCAPILVRRSSMYELPITCGSFFAFAACACFYAALRSEVRRVGWLAGASLAWGLAIGARPTYLFAPFGLILGYSLLFRSADGVPMVGRRALRLWAAAVLPLAVVGLLLAYYNYARFGSPTEFGVSYILSGVYEAKIEHFRGRYVSWNAFAYFLAPGHWGRYFPFFHEMPITWARPRQHYGVDYAFGLLANVPSIWLVFAGLAGLRRGRDATLRAFVGAVGWAALATCAFLLTFYAAMTRYLGDFAPMLALIATVGAFALIDATAERGAIRRVLVRALVGGLALGSIFVVAVVSLTIYTRLRTFNPVSFDRLARIANAPVHAVEALTGGPDGALILTVKFPMGGGDRRDELVRTGWGHQTDRVLVGYPDAAHIQFEYEHADASTYRSQPIAIDRTTEHRVRISLGSFMPPITWSGYRGWTDQQLSFVRHRVTVSIDGATVLDRHQRFYDSSPSALVIGGTGSPEPFRGTIGQVKRERVTAPTVDLLPRDPFAVLPLPPDGVWRAEVRFPVGVPNVREPLIVSGETGRADFLAVEYLGEHEFRFILDHWGSRSLFSPPITYVPDRGYHLAVSHPGYAPDTPVSRAEMVITLDGQVVWTASTALYAAKREDVSFGSNPLGGSSCDERFRGTLKPEIR